MHDLRTIRRINAPVNLHAKLGILQAQERMNQALIDAMLPTEVKTLLPATGIRVEV